VRVASALGMWPQQAGARQGCRMMEDVYVVPVTPTQACSGSLTMPGWGQQQRWLCAAQGGKHDAGQWDLARPGSRWIQRKGTGCVGDRGEEVSARCGAGSSGNRWVTNGKALPFPRCLQRTSIWCAAHVSAGFPVRSIEDAFQTIACLLHGADLLATPWQAIWKVRSCLFCIRKRPDRRPCKCTWHAHHAQHFASMLLLRGSKSARRVGGTN
jgi:hypothetical protein